MKVLRRFRLHCRLNTTTTADDSRRQPTTELPSLFTTTEGAPLKNHHYHPTPTPYTPHFIFFAPPSPYDHNTVSRPKSRRGTMRSARSWRQRRKRRLHPPRRLYPRFRASYVRATALATMFLFSVLSISPARSSSDRQRSALSPFPPPPRSYPMQAP